MRYSSPPNQQAYYEQVWQLVRQIPSGKVASYGQIALMIPPPVGVDFDSYKAFSPRWVGGAMAACPDDVPWQRVINSQGKISPRPGGAEKQRLLLEQEGVEFDAKDRVDWKKYRWKGPNEEDQVEPQQPNLF
jgi:methylated-DNA-protein-cysteine methyltransferase related protein